MILVDGHPQYAAIFGHPVDDSYLSEASERVEVIRGSASVLYGFSAMGGAINIITRDSTRQEWKLLTLRELSEVMGHEDTTSMGLTAKTS